MKVGYKGKQSVDTSVYYAPYVPSDLLEKYYKYLSWDVVDSIKWHRVRANTIRVIDWVLAQDINYWHIEEGYTRDFWLREELYVIFAMRWS